MKVGSIVECVNPYLGSDKVKPLPKGIYTVRCIRQINKDGTVGIEVCEIHNEINHTGFEYGYLITRFREITFPPSLELEINECLTRELIEK